MLSSRPHLFSLGKYMRGVLPVRQSVSEGGRDSGSVRCGCGCIYRGGFSITCTVYVYV